MNSLYRDAILKASQIRKQLGIKMFQPINIFDACTQMGITVRFVDVNMEGFYVMKNKVPTILISTLRPLPRRCFTCGHELGHHVFSHGMKLDILSDDQANSPSRDDNEILVDAFSAALLMPVGAIQAQFAKRSWQINDASPMDFYIIASLFGVGYQTLVMHCKVSGLLSESRSTFLSKFTPAKIFKDFVGHIDEKSYFKVIDQFTANGTIDLEVSNYIVLPDDVQVDGHGFEKVLECEIGNVYVAVAPGIFTAFSDVRDSSYFIRVQRQNYVGYAEYRHLD